MSELVLYSAHPSRGLTNQWLLQELGVAYDLKLLDLEQDEHKTDAFLAINPMGRVPALVHGDAVVTETAAVTLYLAELYPERGLTIPVGSPLRGEYLRWCLFPSITLEPTLFAEALNFKPETYQPFADIETVAETLRVWLRDREFMVGGQFTAADVAVGSAIYWGLNLVPVLPKHPELVRYWSQLEQRDAWQAAVSAH